MRTTVTLEPDTEALVRKAMRERGVTFKRALNDAVRAGLTESGPPVRTWKTYNMGKPKVDLTKAAQIAEQLEDEELIRKMREGR